MKRILLMICLLAFVAALSGCSSGQEQRFASPSGETEIIVRYDFVSRPTVYVDDWPFDREIWRYEGSGFMETVYFQYEWVSETEFIFRYNDTDDRYDEEFLISID